jgi:hypothetical protein
LSRDRKDGKTEHFFNGPGDGDKHGHVVERRDENDNVEYDYARDVEGTEYDVGGGK